MTKKRTIIDSHVHLDMIERYHPNRIQWLKENECCVISWSYFERAHSFLQLKECLESHAQCIRKHYAGGLDCFYLAGIHPRCISADLKPEQVGPLLKPCLEDSLCKGIGEIGLETGDAKEQEIFIAQIEIGRVFSKHGKIIGVHTPRSNKPLITETTLKILARFPDVSASIVVDHCTLETVSTVLDAGLWAGISLSPIKASWDEMRHMASICSDRICRIMCNTDSATNFYEDVVQLSRSNDLPGPIRESLFCRNAAHFFNV